MTFKSDKMQREHIHWLRDVGYYRSLAIEMSGFKLHKNDDNPFNLKITNSTVGNHSVILTNMSLVFVLF